MSNFQQDWEQFKLTGNFLEFSRKWDKELPSNSAEKFQFANNGLTITLVDTGILQIEPATPNNIAVLISSGIHGNETAPMEIVDQMAADIIAGHLKVNVRLMLIIGDPPAVNISKRFLVQNLNRLFSDKHSQSETQDYETERAKTIENAVVDFYTYENDNQQTRYHFDLHTAIRPSQYEKFVVYPFMHDKPWDKEHIAFFGGADITTVLLGNQPAGTFSYYTSNQFDALSATVELGKVKPFGENNMQSFSGIDYNLRQLIQDKPTKKVAFDNQTYKVFKVKQEVIKANNEYNLLLADDVKNFSSFDKGTVLASDGKDQNYVVENDGEAIVFPNNNVPVGQRVGVLLEEIEL